MEERIVAFFAAQVEETLALGDSLVKPLAAAATLLVEVLLAGGRVFTLGEGLAAGAAQQFHALLAHRYRLERPSFAAVCLAGEPLVPASSEFYRRRLRALAQEGDVLVLFAPEPGDGGLSRAVQGAHERDATVIAFTGPGDNNVAALLTPGDVELKVDHPDLSRVLLAHQVALFCLADLIEHQLFGG